MERDEIIETRCGRTYHYVKINNNGDIRLVLHRTGDAAVYGGQLAKLYYEMGLHHNPNGPAIDGITKQWFIHGIRHREDSPAYISRCFAEWWINGELKRKIKFDDDNPNPWLLGNGPTEYHKEESKSEESKQEEESKQKNNLQQMTTSIISDNIVENTSEISALLIDDESNVGDMTNDTTNNTTNNTTDDTYT